ncbi:hypothetical protein TNCV_4746381 [Trichonephila clavipes]|nr:hypothetical protein TNCV_4746381 [Trichonephila clavipes]
MVLLLRAERARKRSSAGVVARGRPGTGLLTQNLRMKVLIPKSLNNTTRHIEKATSACDNPISIHPTARHLNELGKRRL